MGRGNDRPQAATSGLLFGPRRPPTLAARPARRNSRFAARQAYIRTLDSAAAALIAGDGKPLIDLLAAETEPSLLAAEAEHLPTIADRLITHLDGLTREPLPLAASDTSNLVTAMQLLRQRGNQRLLEQLQRSRCEEIILALAIQLVVQDLDDFLVQHHQSIGPLPRLWSNGTSPVFHMRQGDNGQLLCRAPRQRPVGGDKLPASDGQLSPLETTMICRDCLDRWQAGASPIFAGPTQWLHLWQQPERRLDRYHRVRSEASRLFGWGGPAASRSADELRQILGQSYLQQFARQAKNNGVALPSLPANF